MASCMVIAFSCLVQLKFTFLTDASFKIRNIVWHEHLDDPLRGRYHVAESLEKDHSPVMWSI